MEVCVILPLVISKGKKEEIQSMDRQMLVELFRDGMRYPAGRHELWVSRCFEITVRPNRVVQLDEYEGFATDTGDAPKRGRRPRSKESGKMFHVGRSVLHLKEGRVVEESGGGWKEASEQIIKKA